MSANNDPIMYYQVSFWKNIKGNDDTKKHTQEIMAFAHKMGYGVSSLNLVAQQVQAPQPQQEYVEEYAEDEPQ